jgi:hypothetical protein
MLKKFMKFQVGDLLRVNMNSIPPDRRDDWFKCGMIIGLEDCLIIKWFDQNESQIDEPNFDEIESRILQGFFKHYPRK